MKISDGVICSVIDLILKSKNLVMDYPIVWSIEKEYDSLKYLEKIGLKFETSSKWVYNLRFR